MMIALKHTFTILSLAFTIIWTRTPAIGQPPNSHNTEAAVEFLIAPRRDNWVAGLQELQQAVRNDPARFAPVVRDRLMRLPTTLDYYALTDARWSVNPPIAGWPYPSTNAILPVVDLLGRSHAEPILREFFDRVQPLAVEARRRFWQSEDAWIAAGKPARGPDARVPRETWSRFTNARGQTLMVAHRLESPIFIDDILNMLHSDDVAVRDAGAGIVSYILYFADQRPDAIQKLWELVATLAASKNPKDVFAARSMQNKLDAATQSR